MTKKKNTTRKAAAAAVAASAVLACTPMQTEPEMLDISINLSGVRTGQMLSKGAADVLAQTAPASLPPLTLQSKTVPERRYTVTPGIPAQVAVDSYTVTGSYVPAEEGKVYGGSAHATPPFSVSSEITVTAEVTEYEVAASYDCIALVLDPSTTSAYRLRNYAGAMMDISAWLTGTDGWKVVYLKGEWTFPGLALTALPANPADFEEADYELFSDPAHAAGGILVQNGRWYAFGPSGVTTSEGGIVVGLPGWEAGQQ